MSKLISVTEVGYNGVTHFQSKAAAIAGARVKNAVNTTDDPSGCLIAYEESYGAINAIVRVSETAATVLSRANTANTTNNTVTISLTKINDDASTETVVQRIEDILHVYPHPDSSSDSLVVVQDAVKVSTYAYKVDQTVAAIILLANA